MFDDGETLVIVSIILLKKLFILLILLEGIYV